LVNAAGFGMSVGSAYLTKGGGTTLRICGDGVTGRFNISNSNAGVISVGAGSVWIENNCTEAYVSALNPGSATITVTSADTSDSNGKSISLGSKSLTVCFTISLYQGMIGFRFFCEKNKTSITESLI